MRSARTDHRRRRHERVAGMRRHRRLVARGVRLLKLSTTYSEVAAAAAAQSSVRMMRAHIVERRPPIGARASSVLATAAFLQAFLGVTLVRAFLSGVSPTWLRS